MSHKVRYCATLVGTLTKDDEGRGESMQITRLNLPRAYRRAARLGGSIRAIGLTLLKVLNIHECSCCLPRSDGRDELCLSYFSSVFNIIHWTIYLHNNARGKGMTSRPLAAMAMTNLS